ncbi:MAG TPA: RNA-binding S4 domain-containing protein [Rhizomicrobium sp.]|jgi:ribosome-associated heat shock protein Hsp15
MDERSRIDKWLWHARFFRSRALAQNAATSGLIRVNGTRIGKPSASVRPGDVVTLPRGREVVVVRIESLAERRGPAREAQTLYSVVSGTVLDPAAPGS